MVGIWGERRCTEADELPAFPAPHLSSCPPPCLVTHSPLPPTAGDSEKQDARGKRQCTGRLISGVYLKPTASFVDLRPGCLLCHTV